MSAVHVRETTEIASDSAEQTSLDYLHWRDEVLQVMYWMGGEGLGAAPNAAQIQNFLGTDESIIAATLERMVLDDYVSAVGGGYALTAFGRHEGGRSFTDEFSGLTHQGHGECSPNCEFCHGPDGDPGNCPSKGVAHAAPD